MADERLLLRIEEAACRLGISRSTAYQLVATGQLPVVKIGRATRVPAAALRLFIEERLAAAERGETTDGR